MNDETPEKVARDMIAQADILAMMGQQPLSSLKVIEQLKKFAERILNAVNPDEHAARMEPLDPNAPEMVRGEKPWKPLEIPECGIDFNRYHSADFEAYICAWKDGHENISHVYEVRIRKVEEGKFVAVLSNDGRKLGSLSAPTRHLAYRFALGAMRNYLRRGHRKTIRRAAAAAAAGNQPTTND